MVKRKYMIKIVGCFFIAVCWTIFMKVSGTALSYFLATLGSNIIDLIAGMISSMLAVIILLCTHKQDLLRGSISDFRKGLLAGGFLCGYIGIMVIGFFMTEFSNNALQSPKYILMFVLSVFLTGFSEEIVFRGVVLNVIYDCYEKKGKAAIYNTIIISSFIFSLMHLSNIFSGVTVSGSFIQMICAFGIGCYFGAIYIRCKNIWVLILLHSMINFVSLMSTGLLGKGETVGDTVTTISAYSPIKFISVIIFLFLTIYLLRDSKMKYYR